MNTGAETTSSILSDNENMQILLMWIKPGPAINHQSKKVTDKK